MKYVLIISFILMLACNGRKKQALALVTERRLDTGGQLVIKYRFNTGEEWFQDSATIPNSPLPNDSLKLVFTPGKPQENCLELR